MNLPDHLLTAEEVAKLLSIRVGTVYDAASTGRLPVVRLWEGKRRAMIRFRPEDIQRLITDRATAVSTHERTRQR